MVQNLDCKFLPNCWKNGTLNTECQHHTVHRAMASLKDSTNFSTQCCNLHSISAHQDNGGHLLELHLRHIERCLTLPLVKHHCSFSWDRNQCTVLITYCQQGQEKSGTNRTTPLILCSCEQHMHLHKRTHVLQGNETRLLSSAKTMRSRLVTECTGSTIPVTK